MHTKNARSQAAPRPDGCGRGSRTLRCSAYETGETLFLHARESFRRGGGGRDPTSSRLQGERFPLSYAAACGEAGRAQTCDLALRRRPLSSAELQPLESMDRSGFEPDPQVCRTCVLPAYTSSPRWLESESNRPPPVFQTGALPGMSYPTGEEWSGHPESNWARELPGLACSRNTLPRDQGGRTRTCDLSRPRRVLLPSELHPETSVGAEGIAPPTSGL